MVHLYNHQLGYQIEAGCFRQRLGMSDRGWLFQIEARCVLNTLNLNIIRVQ